MSTSATFTVDRGELREGRREPDSFVSAHKCVTHCAWWTKRPTFGASGIDAEGNQVVTATMECECPTDCPGMCAIWRKSGEPLPPVLVF